MVKNLPKPRSPTTTKVFEAFVATLRADPLIGEASADRVKAVLQRSETINSANLQEALFPSEKAKLD